MEFLLAMSIFTSAAGVSLEGAKAQEWMQAWVTRDVGKKAVAAGQGRPQQQQEEARAQVKRPSEEKQRGGLRFALEFDGLNCFETIGFR